MSENGNNDPGDLPDDGVPFNPESGFGGPSWEDRERFDNVGDPAMERDALDDVLDVSTLTAPSVLYHYDTYPSSDASGYAGAWMVWPFGGKVYVSDISTGLHVFTK